MALTKKKKKKVLFKDLKANITNIKSNIFSSDLRLLLDFCKRITDLTGHEWMCIA